MPRPFAMVISRAAHSRTCVTLPGADSRSGRKTVFERRGTARREARPATCADGFDALLDERDQRAAGRALAIRARPGLRAREPALLAAIDAAGAARHSFRSGAGALPFDGALPL